MEYTQEQIDALALVGLSPETVEGFEEKRKHKGRRDARVCVCGHSGGAHYAADGSLTPIDSVEPGETLCQAGRVPCACTNFKWVLTIGDVRSFIQKTEGPGPDHALSKGLASSARRGQFPVWREGIRCFFCKQEPSVVGPLIPIAYNEKGGEALRPTGDNRLHCAECREGIRLGDYSRRG